MRTLVGLAALFLLGCQPQDSTLTDVQRDEIETGVREQLERIYTAVSSLDESMFSWAVSEQDGVCVFDRTMQTCDELWDAMKYAWGTIEKDGVARTEIEGMEIKVVALSPTVAVAAVTIAENRAYTEAGDLNTTTIAGLWVYVLEGGEWRVHSGQSTSWPVE